MILDLSRGVSGAELGAYFVRLYQIIKTLNLLNLKLIYNLHQP